MRRIDAADVMIFLGLVLLAVGLGAFDWRLGVVAVGIVLLSLGLLAAARGAR